jgi:hypothetical protein
MRIDYRNSPTLPWMPISDAPKDGTLFLVWCPEAHGLPSMYSLCAWHTDAGFCVDELREPTHFMLLTEPTISAGLGWKLSPEAKKDIEEIERNSHWG